MLWCLNPHRFWRGFHLTADCVALAAKGVSQSPPILAGLPPRIAARQRAGCKSQSPPILAGLPLKTLAWCVRLRESVSIPTDFGGASTANSRRLSLQGMSQSPPILAGLPQPFRASSNKAEDLVSIPTDFGGASTIASRICCVRSDCKGKIYVFCSTESFAPRFRIGPVTRVGSLYCTT